MATVRCEARRFGVADSFEGSIVPTIKAMGASSEVEPTESSQIAFGPVDEVTNVAVKAIGVAVIVTSGAHAEEPDMPAAAAAPAPGEYIADGGYAIIELGAGEAIAVVLADLG